MRHVNLDSIDGVVDAFHKKISALTLGQGNSSCPWGSAIVTLTLTPHMLRLLITQNSALWPSKEELNQPEMVPHRWHHGSGALR